MPIETAFEENTGILYGLFDDDDEDDDDLTLRKAWRTGWTKSCGHILKELDIVFNIPLEELTDFLADIHSPLAAISIIHQLSPTCDISLHESFF